jgi:hypothetical protein
VLNILIFPIRFSKPIFPQIQREKQGNKYKIKESGGIERKRVRERKNKTAAN